MKRSIESIQFLRFVAASFVAFFHTVGAIGKYYPGQVPERLSYFAGIGASGVHIFFVISGFVMVFATCSPSGFRLSPKQFLLRRILRIYPIYFVYASIYIVFYYQVTGAFHSTGLQMAASLLLLPGYSAYVIGPGWTLSYEMYFYFCFSLILFTSMPKGLVFLSLFFLTSVTFGLTKMSDPTLHVLTSSLLLEFLCGAWIAYFVLSATEVSSKLALLILVLGLAGFSAGLLFGYSRGPSLIVWGVPSAFLLCGLVLLERNGKVFWITRHLSFLGDSSYSLYLLHILIIDICLLALPSLLELSSAEVLPIAAIITLLCIAISATGYALIERRLILRLSRVGRSPIRESGVAEVR